MAFVKLDTGILDSTLWVTRDPREVFITALLMAVPKEYEEDQPTWEVRSLEKTDFVVPPGWYGFVPASGPGIVRRAGVPLDDGLDALVVLGQPDPESRSSEWEGRRLVRVDGGFVVLNFMKYRDRDDTTAERSRRYRERKAMLRATSATRDAPRVTPFASPAEAEAEAELKTVTVVEGGDTKPPKARSAHPPDKPEGVTDEVWADWLALRAKKRAPVTGTVLREAAREADKAGLPLDRFLSIWCARGSQGMQADWLRPDERRPVNGPQPSGETPYQRQMRERMQSIVPGVAAKAPGTKTQQPTEGEVFDVTAKRMD